MRAMNIIDQINQEEMARLSEARKGEIPPFAAGDAVTVRTHVLDGGARRLQNFSGTVIAVRRRGLHSSFIVRRTSSGEAMERTFQTHSPLIESVLIDRRGDVRRAKLYYLRQRSGKSARIREKLKTSKTRQAPAAQTSAANSDAADSASASA